MKSEKSQTKDTAEQDKSSKYEWLRPWQFKPGQSGNPNGKAKGTISLKEYAKRYLQELDEEGKKEFMEGLDKDVIWKMAEGNPKQDTEIKGHLTISEVLDQLDGQTTSGQELETEPPVQNPEQEGGVDTVPTQPSTAGLPPEEVVSQPNS